MLRMAPFRIAGFLCHEYLSTLKFRLYHVRAWLKQNTGLVFKMVRMTKGGYL
jgi:hypothetical protein